MEKYNDIVSLYLDGKSRVDEVIKGQEAILLSARKVASERVENAFHEFTEAVENHIKDWSQSDYDEFIAAAEQDSRIDSSAKVTISTAYARTHKDGIEKIKNSSVCKDALRCWVSERVSDILDDAEEKVKMLGGVRDGEDE